MGNKLFPPLSQHPPRVIEIRMRVQDSIDGIVSQNFGISMAGMTGRHCQAGTTLNGSGMSVFQRYSHPFRYSSGQIRVKKSPER